MSLYDNLPPHMQVWLHALEEARERGDLASALMLRRADAVKAGVDPAECLAEERRWWATHRSLPE